MTKRMIAGVDLAWMGGRNPTAIAVGRYESAAVSLITVVENLVGTPSVILALDSVEELHGVAIDGPLVITNATGQRRCENSVSSKYGSRKASCHTSNLIRFPDAAGTRVAAHLTGKGFQHLAATDRRWQIECYPHPALIEMFGLPERLRYKKGGVALKRSGQVELGHFILKLERSPVLPLIIPHVYQSHFDGDNINVMRGRELKHNEDVLDAIICMYIGALYQHGVRERVHGSADAGYIYVPEVLCV